MTTVPRETKETEHSGADPLPADADTGDDDGLLDSVGKAITAPIRGAAEDDEPSADPKKPPQPPG